MKLIPSTLAAGLVLITSSSATLIAHYTLDETSGTIAADSSGNGNDMTWQGTGTGPNWAAGGQVGGAYNFSGLDDDSFMTTTFSLSPSTPLTMAGWVNTASGANDTLAFVGNGGVNNSYYTTKIQNGAVRVVGRNTGELNVAGGAVNDSTWHHFASVYVSATERHIYVDGILANTDTRDVPAVDITRIGIGALTRGTGPVDEFTGLLDDIQIYSDPLTSDQISFLHANPGATVPEPSAAVLLSLALGAGFTRRRRA